MVTSEYNRNLQECVALIKGHSEGKDSEGLCATLEEHRVPFSQNTVLMEIWQFPVNQISKVGEWTWIESIIRISPTACLPPLLPP